MRTAEIVCYDKNGLTWAHLCNTAGCIEYERGHPAQAKPYMEISRAIREKLLPPDHEDIADSYNNFANYLLTESLDWSVLDEAESLYKKSVAIHMTKPADEYTRVLHTRHINLGAVYTWKKQYDLAEKHIEIARNFAIQTFGPECHFQARSVPWNSI